MNKTFKKICMAAALTAGSSVAMASPINIGGVIFDPDSFFDFSASTNLIENVAIVPGTVIDGYGLINDVNGTTQSTFCPSCELTWEFGGFTLLTDLTTASIGDSFQFTGGWLKVYVDKTPDYDPLSKATATDGDLWLELTAVDLAGNNGGVTLSGTLTSPTADGIAGQGTGFFDVAGGMAANNLDTNGQLGGRDFFYSSSFQPLTNPTPEGYTHFGTSEMHGDAIPEPSTIALFGLSLLGLGLVRRKMKA